MTRFRSRCIVAGAVIAVLSIGISAFFVARGFLHERTTEAQPLPPMIQARIEEAKKPLFEGTINGITFKKEVGPADLGAPGCLPKEASPEEIAASPLDFTPTYLPPGFSLVLRRSRRWWALPARAVA